MRHRHDRLAKQLLRRTLETEGTFTPELEVFGPGVYEASPVMHAGLVVLNELPETADPLIPRLMSKGRTLRRALAELARLPEDARERQVALPVLLDYREEVAERPTRTPEDEEFLMDTQDIVETRQR